MLTVLHLRRQGVRGGVQPVHVGPCSDSSSAKVQEMFHRAAVPGRKVVAASLHSANAASRSAAANGATLARASSASAALDSSGSSSGALWKAEPSNGDWSRAWRKHASLCDAKVAQLSPHPCVSGVCISVRWNQKAFHWKMKFHST